MYKTLSFLFCIACLVAGRASAAQNSDVHAVVFDFGGVIAHADQAKMVNFLMRSFDVKREELSAALQKMQSFVSQGGTEQEYWEQLASEKKVSLPKNWIDQWYGIIKSSITEIPESIVIVRALQEQGYRTGLLSDITQYQAEVVRKLGYYDLFDPVLLSYETGVKKPDPKAFTILLETLHESPSHVLFIDDKLENVESARSLGIDAIQFTSPQQLKAELEERGFTL